MLKRLLLTLILIVTTYNVSAQNNLPDPDFGTAGIVTATHNIDSFERIETTVKLTDNLILVGGTMNKKIMVARFNTETNSIDTSFGVNGKFIYTLTNYSYNSVTVLAMKVQADGKILVVTGEDSVMVLRLNADGSQDMSFGGTVNGDSGVVVLDNNPALNSFEPTKVEIQNDGKILVGGNDHYEVASVLYGKLCVIRLNPDGAFDNTFDSDGIAQIIPPISKEGYYSSDMKLQADGKIVLSGSYKYALSSAADILMARFNDDGSADTSFDNDGIAVTSMASANSEFARCMELLPDGKILVAGNMFNTSFVNTKLFLLRYNPNGTLDTAFGTSGKVTATTTMALNDDVRQLLLNSDGSFYVGIESDYVSNGIKVIKYNANGTRANSFGPFGNGIVTRTSISTNTLRFMHLAPDGGLVTGGTRNNHLLFDYFNTAGLHTSTFEAGPFSNIAYTAAHAVNILPNDKMIVSGNYNNEYALGNGMPLLIKYNADGTPDTSFGNGGKFTNSTIISKQNFISRIQPDGKILVISKISNIVFRVNANGTPDTTFGTNGVVSFSDDYAIFDVYPLANGKILMAYDIGDLKFSMARLNYDGTIDTSFGTNGITTTTIGTYSYSMCIAVTSDNKVLISGSSWNTDGLKPCVVRYFENGTVDTSFGIDGIAVMLAQEGSLHNFQTMMLTNDGKILICGTRFSAPTSGYAVRFNGDGTPDMDFGTEGRIGIPHTVYGVALTTDNKLIVSGTKISRYFMNGVLDTNFGNSGSIAITTNQYPRQAIDVKVQADNKIVAAIFNWEIFTAARFLQDNELGTIDIAARNNTTYIYPNPVAEATHFTYTLRTNTTVTIRLFDLQGKLLKTYLDNENQSAGQFDQLIVMPDNLIAGNYVLKISTPEGVNSVKLVKK
jgi:uncharacterized delta-60 repeat protein